MSFKLEVDDFILVDMPSGRHKVILLFECPQCNKRKEIDDFGLRCHKGKGPEGEDLHTRQSWCRDCR